MIYSAEVERMCPVAKGAYHGPAPVPEEGKWVQVAEGAIGIALNANKSRTKPLRVILNGLGKDTAGPASYGMTDTMGRMHSDAQFAGSPSVPAHVEMMDFLGMGNNPMVGATVAVEQGLKKSTAATQEHTVGARQPCPYIIVWLIFSYSELKIIKFPQRRYIV
jgi:hypothetical protein